MPTPSALIIQVLAVFATAFTAPTFTNALVLLYGTILAPGRRTVTAALRMMGLAHDPHFTNYHRVLNRTRWSLWVVSRLLLALIIATFLPPGAPLLLVIDETLERRRGDQIKFKGWFRDPIRSTVKQVNYALGIRWITLALLVPVPWSRRGWALPFMTIPALSPKTSAKLGKPHRTVAEWAKIMISKVRRWQPDRDITLVGDGSYAVVALGDHCRKLPRAVHLVSRLRLDARLHDAPAPRPKGKRGPQPKKGARQPALATRVDDPQTVWQETVLPWYGGEERRLELATGVALWYHPGSDPLPIRWVLLRDPQGKFKPQAFFCTNTQVAPEQILGWFIARWGIEVTFEELRAYLGFETQREWSDQAVARTTPCLFGVFSLVVIMAKVLHPSTLPIRQTQWYAKDEATFSDALAVVRRDLWRGANSSTSTEQAEMLLIPKAVVDSLQEVACYSA